MLETSPELCSARPRTGEPNATFGCTEATTLVSLCLHVHSINASVGPSPDEATTVTWCYQSNQQFSITAVTTSSGSVAERYAYTAYGQPTILDGSGSALSSSAINNRYSYTGREWDQTLALYHFRARWMSGLAGRLLGRDPIGNKPGPALYEFVVSGPLHFIDPDGLKCRIAVAAGHTWDIDSLEEKLTKPDGPCDYFVPLCCNSQSTLDYCKKKGRDILPGAPIYPGVLRCKANEKISSDDRSVEEEFPKIMQAVSDTAKRFCDPINPCKCNKVQFDFKCHLQRKGEKYPAMHKCLDLLFLPFKPCRLRQNGNRGSFFTTSPTIPFT